MRLAGRGGPLAHAPFWSFLSGLQVHNAQRREKELTDQYDEAEAELDILRMQHNSLKVSKSSEHAGWGRGGVGILVTDPPLPAPTCTRHTPMQVLHERRHDELQRLLDDYEELKRVRCSCQCRL